MLKQVLLHFIKDTISALVRWLTQRQVLVCLVCRRQFRACDSDASELALCQECGALDVGRSLRHREYDVGGES